MTIDTPNTAPVKSSTTEDIASLLEKIFTAAPTEAAAGCQQLATHPAMRRAVDAVQGYDCDIFHHAFLRPMEQMVEGILAGTIPGKRHAQFILQHKRFVEMHMRRLIIEYEGYPGSQAKTWAINWMLMRYDLTGERISFDWLKKFIPEYCPPGILTKSAAASPLLELWGSSGTVFE